MSIDPETTRIVRLWLRTDEHESADRVLDTVLAEIDTTPQRRATWWPARRLPQMNRSLGAALAIAAVVVLITFIGMQALGTPSVGGPGNPEQPSPSSTRDASGPVGSTAPTPHPNLARSLAAQTVQNGPLDPGDYTYYAVDGTLVNVMFTVPAGWEWEGWHLNKTGLEESQFAAIAFWAGDLQVYTDPCNWAGAEPEPPTGRSVRDLVTALAAQPMRTATGPTERKAAGLGGPDAWDGLAVELTVPEDIDLAECDRGQFRSWGPEESARFHQGPGQRDLVWVVDTQGNGVDVDGERLIIDAASFPETPAEVQSEIEAILDSMVIGHWG